MVDNVLVGLRQRTSDNRAPLMMSLSSHVISIGKFTVRSHDRYATKLKAHSCRTSSECIKYLLFWFSPYVYLYLCTFCTCVVLSFLYAFFPFPFPSCLLNWRSNYNT